MTKTFVYDSLGVILPPNRFAFFDLDQKDFAKLIETSFENTSGHAEAPFILLINDTYFTYTPATLNDVMGELEAKGESDAGEMEQRDIARVGAV